MSEHSRRDRPSKPLVAAVGLAVAAVTFVCFWPALFQGFQEGWDDDRNFLRNDHLRGLSWETVKWAFTTFHMGPYQPLSWLSLAVDHELWGGDVAAGRYYHATNMFLHAANATLLYVLALRLLPRIPSGTRPPVLAAAAGALWFSIHPLRVESVAWATERRDVLSGFFVLLTLLAWLRAESHRRRLWWAGLAYLCALLSKASAMTLPFVLLILDAWPLRRIRFEGLWPRGCGPALAEKLPFLMLAGGAAAVALLGQGQVGALRSWEEHGLLQRTAQACYGLVWYLGKTLWPAGLSPLYELEYRLDPFRARYVASMSAVAAITATTFLLRRRRPALFATWIAYAVLASPTLGFVQAGSQIVADRYSYLPSLALALLAAGAAARWRALLPPLFVVLAVFGSLTVAQTRKWKDSETLWRHAVHVDPGSQFAHHQLAHELHRRGDYEAAERHYRRALELQGDRPDPETLNNLGAVLWVLGRKQEAVRFWRRGAALDPEGACAQNLAHALEELGREKGR